MAEHEHERERCCGDWCWAEDTDQGPCWGPVEVVGEIYPDEDGGHTWVHACKGHFDMYDGEGPYVPQPVLGTQGGG